MQFSVILILRIEINTQACDRFGSCRRLPDMQCPGDILPQRGNLLRPGDVWPTLSMCAGVRRDTVRNKT